MVQQDDFVEPAVKGALNVLNACSRAKSVRRVVYTSSVAAACPLNEEGELIRGCSLDESRWTPVDIMRRKHQNPSGVSTIYCLPKITLEIYRGRSADYNYLAMCSFIPWQRLWPSKQQLSMA